MRWSQINHSSAEIFSKCQLILKCLLGVINFIQKTKKQIKSRYHSSKVEFIRSFFERFHGLTICFWVLLTFIRAYKNLYITITERLLIFLVIRISSTILVDCPQLVSEEWYKKDEGRLKQMKGLFSVFFSANTKAQLVGL